MKSTLREPLIWSGFFLFIAQVYGQENCTVADSKRLYGVGEVSLAKVRGRRYD
ncbi:hypothetical protein [Paenibacillus sp. CCS19]|uniref:hypothetical protein n=1 Tax=Paenibacillus sp. CCS19 TaxID=3158387 RepID=UPI00295E929B|nr:hypothetical protein [Paenibacillus cellulosilyticus]